MGRRDNLNWRKWLLKNQQHLISDCGLPLNILKTEFNWEYFLAHGESPPIGGELGFSIQNMPKKDALNLCLFLELELAGDPIQWNDHTLNSLQYLLKRGKHEESEIL